MIHVGRLRPVLYVMLCYDTHHIYTVLILTIHHIVVSNYCRLTVHHIYDLCMIYKVDVIYNILTVLTVLTIHTIRTVLLLLIIVYTLRFYKSILYYSISPLLLTVSSNLICL